VETAAIITAAAFAVLIAFLIVVWLVVGRRVVKMQDRVMDSVDRGFRSDLDDIGGTSPRRVRSRRML
jgi:hypothetical protein